MLTNTEVDTGHEDTVSLRVHDTEEQTSSRVFEKVMIREMFCNGHAT